MDIPSDVRERILEYLFGDISNSYRKSQFKSIKNYELIRKVGFLSEDFYQDSKKYMEALSYKTVKCEKESCKNNVCYYEDMNDYGIEEIYKQPYCLEHMNKCKICGDKTYYNHEDGNLPNKKYNHCYCYKCKTAMLKKMRDELKRQVDRFFNRYHLSHTFYDDYKGEICPIYVYHNARGNSIEIWPYDEYYEFVDDYLDVGRHSEDSEDSEDSDGYNIYDDY